MSSTRGAGDEKNREDGVNRLFPPESLKPGDENRMDLSLLIRLIPIIFLFLLLEGFLSGSEIAMVAADRKRLSRFSGSGSRWDRLTFRILKEPSWFLSTTLVGSNLAEVANAALVTSLLTASYGSRGDLYAFLILAPLVLIFGEILPKTLFQQKADSWVRKIVPVIWAVSLILYPLVWLMSKATQSISRFLKQEGEVRPLVTREELQLLLREEGGQSDINSMELEMIRRIFRFSATKVKEVMIPLVDVVALEETCSVEEAIASVRQENYSRSTATGWTISSESCIVLIFSGRSERGPFSPLSAPALFSRKPSRSMNCSSICSETRRPWPRWWTSTGERWESSPSRTSWRKWSGRSKTNTM
jgi:hypothetical protein